MSLRLGLTFVFSFQRNLGLGLGFKGIGNEPDLTSMRLQGAVSNFQIFHYKFGPTVVFLWCMCTPSIWCSTLQLSVPPFWNSRSHVDEVLFGYQTSNSALFHPTDLKSLLVQNNKPIHLQDFKMSMKSSNNDKIYISKNIYLWWLKMGLL